MSANPTSDQGVWADISWGELELETSHGVAVSELEALIVDAKSRRPVALQACHPIL